MKEGARVHHSYGSYAPSTYGSYEPRRANLSTGAAAARAPAPTTSGGVLTRVPCHFIQTLKHFAAYGMDSWCPSRMISPDGGDKECPGRDSRGRVCHEVPISAKIHTIVAVIEHAQKNTNT
jgi:hypothetical protein